MSQFIVNSFSITPKKISTGTTHVKVTYNFDMDEASQNPVTVQLFVLSSLAVSFDVATSNENLTVGNNAVTRDRTISAHSNITSDKIIKIMIRVEGKDGGVSSRSTTITYSAD